MRAIWILVWAAEAWAQPADLVLRNGKIVTMNGAAPTAQASAVRGDKIMIHRAKKRGLEATLSFEEFLGIVAIGKCVYCDTALTWPMYNKIGNRIAVSQIDRVNNDLGYVSGNCAPCCKT